MHGVREAADLHPKFSALTIPTEIGSLHAYVDANPEVVVRTATMQQKTVIS